MEINLEIWRFGNLVIRSSISSLGRMNYQFDDLVI
jgi:hypothetical protein